MKRRARTIIMLRSMNCCSGKIAIDTNKKPMMARKSQIRSRNSAESDCEKGIFFSVFNKSGLAISTLPGIKLPAATPAMIERNENGIEIICCEAPFTNNFQRHAFRIIFMAVTPIRKKNKLKFKCEKTSLKSMFFNEKMKRTSITAPNTGRIFRTILR